MEGVVETTDFGGSGIENPGYEDIDSSLPDVPNAELFTTSHDNMFEKFRFLACRDPAIDTIEYGSEGKMNRKRKFIRELVVRRPKYLSAEFVEKDAAIIFERSPPNEKFYREFYQEYYNLVTGELLDQVKNKTTINPYVSEFKQMFVNIFEGNIVESLHGKRAFNFDINPDSITLRESKKKGGSRSILITGRGEDPITIFNEKVVFHI